MMDFRWKSYIISYKFISDPSVLVADFMVKENRFDSS